MLLPLLLNNLLGTRTPTFDGPTISNFALTLNVAMVARNYAPLFSDDQALTFTALGSLPNGLSLSSAGVLSGTPSVAAAFAGISIRATDLDTNTVASNTFTITVSTFVQAAYPRWMPLVLGRRLWWLRRVTTLTASATAEAAGAAQWAKYGLFRNIEIDVHSVPGYPRPNYTH